MMVRSYLNLLRRLFIRRAFCVAIIIVYLLCLRIFYKSSAKVSLSDSSTKISEERQQKAKCDICVSTDEFLQAYQSKSKLGLQLEPTRAEPSVERLEKLFQILRKKESEYQSLLKTFDVFDMTDPMETIQNNEKRNSNVDEMKLFYNRYIHLSDDKQTVTVNRSFIDYLRTVSNYLSDGLRDQRTKKVGESSDDF